MTDTSTAPVEALSGISVIRASGDCRDWNGIRYKTGMAAHNVGSTSLSMNVATIPPGGVAKAHIHVGFEVMLFILEGRAATSSTSSLAFRTRCSTSVIRSQ
jgi:uncharacterized RmlC-like cupin family protein